MRYIKIIEMLEKKFRGIKFGIKEEDDFLFITYKEKDISFLFPDENGKLFSEKNNLLVDIIYYLDSLLTNEEKNMLVVKYDSANELSINKKDYIVNDKIYFMTDFTLTKFNKDVVLMANSFVSPLNNLKSLNTLLKELEVKGNIYVDLTLSNGLYAPNRFLKLYFDGNNIDIKSIEVAEDISEALIKNINMFHKNYCTFDMMCVLTEQEKHDLLFVI